MTAKKFIPNYHLSKQQYLIGIIFFAALLFLFRYESILKIGTHYLGTPHADGGLYVWLFNSNLSNLFELAWFNTKGFYPYTQSLAWSDNFILPSLLAAPFVKLGLSSTIAYNVILLLALFLNAFLTYRLAFQLSNHLIGSLVAGTSFFVFPFITLHLGHPQLQFAFWIPLALSILVNFLHDPKLKHSLLLGLVCFLSFLTTVYYTFFILMLLEWIIIFLILQKYKFFNLSRITNFISGFCLGLFPIVFFLPPYFNVQATFGYRALRDSFSFGADFFSYLAAPHLSYLHSYGHELSHTEALLFPGTVALLTIFLIAKFLKCKLKPISLAILFLALSGSVLSTISGETFNNLTAIVFWIILLLFIFINFYLGKLEKKLELDFISNQGIILILLSSAFCFYFISLGPLGLGESFLESPGLYTVYYHYFPGAAALRAIGRTGVVVALLLALLIPFLIRALEKNKKLSFIGLVFLLITCIENYPKYYALEPHIETHPVFKNINNYAKDTDVVIGLPLTKDIRENGTVKSWRNFATHNVNYLYWLKDSGLHSFNGYSGQRSRNMLTFPGLLKNFPDKTSVRTLNQISKLKYIIFVSRNVDNFNEQEFSDRLREHSDSFTLLESDPHKNYLIEFHGSSKVDSNFYLQHPSHPAGQTLKFRLKATGVQSETTPVNVFLKKHYEKNAYKTIEVIADGNWHEYEISTPKTIDRVRPLFFRFEALDINAVLMIQGSL